MVTKLERSEKQKAWLEYLDKRREALGREEDENAAFAAFMAGWNARKLATFNRAFGVGGLELQQRALRMLSKDTQLELEARQNTLQKLRHFVTLIEERQKELSVPEPPRSSVDWLFWPVHCSAVTKDLLDSAKDVVFTLLWFWAAETFVDERE